MATIKEVLSLPFVKTLNEAGGEVYAVGGCVRDLMLKKESKDIDLLVLGLDLDEIAKVLEGSGKVDLVGESFGIIKFTPPGFKEPIDIAMPRKDTKIEGEAGHRSIQVVYDKNISVEEDMARRDFTINSLAMNINGFGSDYFGGYRDIKNKIIKATSTTSFIEDPLRLIRAIQFAARFEFTIESETWKLIDENAHLIKEITGERILEEIKKIVEKGNKSLGVQLLVESGIYNALFDWEFNADSYPHFNNCKTLSDFMFLFLPDRGRETFIDRLKGDITTYKQMRALAALYDAHPHIEHLQMVGIFSAYKIAPEVITESGILLDRTKETIETMKKENLPFSYKDLPITGDDLIALGLKGQEVGKQLENIVLALYKREIKNNRQEILDYVSKVHI